MPAWAELMDRIVRALRNKDGWVPFSKLPADARRAIDIVVPLGTPVIYSKTKYTSKCKYFRGCYLLISSRGEKYVLAYKAEDCIDRKLREVKLCKPREIENCECHLSDIEEEDEDYY